MVFWICLDSTTLCLARRRQQFLPILAVPEAIATVEVIVREWRACCAAYDSNDPDVGGLYLLVVTEPNCHLRIYRISPTNCSLLQTRLTMSDSMLFATVASRNIKDMLTTPANPTCEGRCFRYMTCSYVDGPMHAASLCETDSLVETIVPEPVVGETRQIGPVSLVPAC